MIAGVWPAIFVGIGVSIIIGLASNMFPIYWMNIHDCWTTEKCGDGSHGTILYVAKWYGTIGGAVLGTFATALFGPAIQAMTSMQVSNPHRILTVSSPYPHLILTSSCHR